MKEFRGKIWVERYPEEAARMAPVEHRTWDEAMGGWWFDCAGEARPPWPMWASKVAAWAEPEDAGVGDTIQRKLGLMGESLKNLLASMGVECGCAARRAEWNAKYPYQHEGVVR